MNNFDIYKLDELTHHITDGEHGSVKDDANSNYYLLSNKNIVNGQVIINDNDRKIAFETFKKINKRTKLEIGDVVISTVGVLGKTAIIKNKINFDFQRSVGIIKVNSNLLDNRYLYYYLNLDFVRKRINDLSKGAVQKCFFISDLKNLEIHLPKNIESQQKIAKVLSDLDAKIELNNKINAELEAMAKTLYDYWFVQFDFPFDFAQGKPVPVTEPVEVPGLQQAQTPKKGYKSSGGKMVWNEELKREIPEGWEVKELGKLIRPLESGKRPKGGIDKDLKNGIPSLGAESIDKLGYFNYKSTKYIPFSYKERITSGVIQNNDILIYKDGAYVGKTTLFRDNFPFEFATINEHVFLLRSSKSYFQEYLFFTLKLESYYNLMQSLGQKAAQPGLNQNDLKSLNIIEPNHDIVMKYQQIIEPFFARIFNNSKENQELASLRDWLLPMLMNGQVTVASTGSATTTGSATKTSSATDEQLSMVAEEKVEYKK